MTGWTVLQHSKDRGCGAKDVPRDGPFLWLNIISLTVVPKAILLSPFRPCGFIYLVRFTLMCSAAALGNIFTLPTQNINLTDLKKCIEDHRLVSALIKISVMMFVCRSFLSSECLWFSSCLLGWTTNCILSLSLSSRGWKLQEALAIFGPEHHRYVCWGPVGSFSWPFLGVSPLG